jgi:hypothetical protein
MPALTPEQRRKQMEMQRQREAAAKAANKPKRGQKGAQTSGGSKTKGDTVGGAKPISKPTTKPATKPTTKPKVADYNDAQGNTYDGNTGRLKSKVAPKPAAKPAPKPSSGGRTYASASTPATTASVTEKPQSNAGMKNQNKDYRGNLFEKTFGYKRGEAPDQLAKRANYAGTDTGVNPSTKVDKNYADKKPANQTPVAYGKDTKLVNEPAKPASPSAPPSPNQPKKYDKASKGMTLAERIRRRRLGLD